MIFLLFLLLVAGCAHSKYQGPPEFSSIQAPMAEFGEKEAKKYGMRLIVVGRATEQHNIPYSVAFMCEKEMCIKGGRVLATSIVRDFLQMLQTSQLMKNQRVKSNPVSPRLETIGVKIGFWDKQVNRFKRPNLAEITFRDGIFSYYEPDPYTTQPRLVLKETYEEALREI